MAGQNLSHFEYPPLFLGHAHIQQSPIVKNNIPIIKFNNPNIINGTE